MPWDALEQVRNYLIKARRNCVTVPLSECVDVFSLCSLQAGGLCQGGSREGSKGILPSSCRAELSLGESVTGSQEGNTSKLQGTRLGCSGGTGEGGREAELFLIPDTSRRLWAEGTAKHQRSWSRAGEFPAQAVLLLSRGGAGTGGAQCPLPSPSGGK